MSAVRLAVATANPGKVAEIEVLLAGVAELVPRPADVPEVVEDAGTLIGNARLKARAICAATGLPAVADDTGLEVAALGGEPGVETAYFAGPQATDADNRAKLLRELEGAADRSAAFLEATKLAGFSDSEARRFFGKPLALNTAAMKYYLTPWSAETAKRRFLRRFNELADPNS